MKFQKITRGHILLTFAFSLVVIFTTANPCVAQEQEDEETYSISLVQTAEVEKDMHEVEGRNVLTESYTVEEGDHVWNILRNKGLLEKRNLAEILDVLKKLNSSLTNLDLIHPGEKIIIPLVIAPVEGGPLSDFGEARVTFPLEDIEGIEGYTVRSGDSMIKIVKDLYDIPEEDLYDEYLDQLKKMNPFIGDLNRIYPGQIVRLPIYSPSVVRMPIKQPQPSMERETLTGRGDPKLIGQQLGEIFTLIGEEWSQTGTHFIPLKTGGQINLNAESYPIIDLRSGNRVIVDLNNDLPEKMADLITSNWESYSIVHLEGNEDLRGAFDKIIGLCDYEKIYSMDEPLVLGGDIPLRITADWIIRSSAGNEDIIAINLFNNERSWTPRTIRTFLESLGIKVIDYPPPSEIMEEPVADLEILDAGDDRFSLMEIILNLTGRTFLKNTEIPIYKNQDADFNLLVKADFFLEVEGIDYIIDLSGLGQDIIDLLKENRFRVLSVFNEKLSSTVVTKTLEFLGVEFDSNSHPFLAADRAESKNIRLMIPGIVFNDSQAQTIFATHLRLSPEIMRFLAQKGYRIFRLPPS